MPSIDANGHSKPTTRKITPGNSKADSFNDCLIRVLRLAAGVLAPALRSVDPLTAVDIYYLASDEAGVDRCQKLDDNCNVIRCPDAFKRYCL